MSVPLRVAEVERWTGGRRLQGDAGAVLRGVSTDTRSLAAGQLFVALRGPHHDAHDHLAEALTAGAAGLLVERDRRLPPDTPAELPVVAVDDTTRGLGALAAGHRAGFDGPVVAITGSNGKTTVKEMCAGILSGVAPCLKTRGNLNNQIGLPLTLLEREPEHRALVVEIGMNHRGEIAPLAAIARPTVGVITNVGTAHIEFLGSQEEIALEKGDLVASLAAEATAVLNADDFRVMAQAARTAARVVRYGVAAEAEVRAEAVRRRPQGGFAFELVTPDGRRSAEVDGLGEPTVPNALAAAAAAWVAGADPDQLVEGLSRHRPVPGRMEPRRLASGAVVVNDTYNANPQSMEAALRAVAELRGTGRLFAALGSMGELGDAADRAHREIGRLVAELGAERLHALGEHAAELVAGALEAGMETDRVRAEDRHEEIADVLAKQLRPGDWVLVKGSRSARMERVVEALGAQGEEG